MSSVLTSSAPKELQKILEFYFSETLNQLDAATVISCDVFDTLLFRLSSTPHYLFKEIGSRLEKDGLLPSDSTPEMFVAARQLAENIARKEGKNFECTLEQIAEKMDMICEPKILLEYELNVELDFSYLNRELVKVLDYLKKSGKKIILTTDTYFSSRQLAKILKNAGFPLALVDKLYVSSELQVNKAGGGMYNKILLKFNPADKIIHIGDNKKSDVEKALNAGITPQYIGQRGVIENILLREKIVSNSWKSAFSFDSLREVVAREQVNEPEHLQLFFKIGATVFGPLLSRYAEWCIRDCVKNGVTDILAFTREAETFLPLLKNERIKQRAEINVVPFYISRQAISLASLEEINGQALYNEMQKSKPISYAKHLDLLGLDSEKFSQLLDISNTSAKVKKDDFRFLIKKILRNEEALTCIKNSIAQKRKEFLEYFSTISLHSDSIAVADLGFAGRTQKFFSTILKTTHSLNIRGYYTCLGGGAAMHMLENRTAMGYLSYSEHKEESTLSMIKHPEIFEQSLIAHYGSVLGYSSGTPILEKVLPLYYQVEETNAVRRGIMAFQKAYMDIRTSIKSPDSFDRLYKDIDKENLYIQQRFFTFPFLEEVKGVGRWIHDDNYGTTNKGYICNTAPHDGYLAEEEKTNWPQGKFCIEKADFLNSCFEVSSFLKKV